MLNLSIIITSLGFLILACVFTFAWAPLLTTALYRWKILRTSDHVFALPLPGRETKRGTPIMGGLLVIVTVAVLSIAFNWNQRFTWVPIGVMLLSSALGGIDDVLNIFGSRRSMRSFERVVKLTRVHRYWWMRLYYLVSLPWVAYKRFFFHLGSYPGKGIQAHEKILFQFLAGAMTAWWIYVKLGPEWRAIWIPWNGELALGILLVPFIILTVMATANAVNVADGLDGLAGGTLITAFGGLLILAWIQGNIFFAILNAMAIGSLLTYTYFNIKPARFQMGDVGSLGLGALLAVMAIAQNRILVLPLFGFVFFLDLFSVIIQSFGRRILNRRIFALSPLHHHFEARGWSEEKIVMRAWVINAIMVMVGLWIALH
ncbi:MAG: phospho-N-acetylmuramoyl-pentapeptide-transferase [Patescibacteria group bacterium]